MIGPGISINQEDYEAFRTFLEDACGIMLGDNKHYLITSRLSRLMREHSLSTLGDLISYLKFNPDPYFQDRIIDAMTTNETSWFRDVHPYEALEKLILPEVTKNTTDLRIWSAACSTGQEPYSISMLVDKFLNTRGKIFNTVSVIATDISPSVLKAAREGIYDNLSMARGLSKERKKLYFDEIEPHWKIKESVKNLVQFKEINLLNNFLSLGKFDCIFCRNVLIYFSLKVKKDIIRRLTDSLKPGGYLILGGSESVTSYSDQFETIRFLNGFVYKRKTQ